MQMHGRLSKQIRGTRFVPLICFCILINVLIFSSTAPSQQPSGDRTERFRLMSRQAESRGLAEPFKGVTTNGNIVPGLFSIRSIGVSTEPGP